MRKTLLSASGDMGGFLALFLALLNAATCGFAFALGLSAPIGRGNVHEASEWSEWTPPTADWRRVQSARSA